MIIVSLKYSIILPIIGFRVARLQAPAKAPSSC